MDAVLLASDLAQPTLGQVTVVNPAPGGGTSNEIPFPVALAPAINAGGTVDAAGYNNRPLAAGSLASTFGQNLAVATATAGPLPLPQSLAATVLRLGALAAPLIFVSPGQINFQVPWEMAGQPSAGLQASVADISGTAQSVRFASYSPGVFTISQSGTGQGAVLIANSGTTAAPVGRLPGSRPAERGEAISVFCTGLGPVSNTPNTGAAAPSDPLSATLTLPAITLGGLPADVAFAGLAPGFVGLYQINLLVPQTTPTGDAVPLVVTMGGIASNTVTIAVR